MKPKSLTLIAVAAIAMASTRASAQFIPVTNGSFEEPTTTSYILVNPGTDSTTVPGWTFSSPNQSGISTASSASSGAGYGGVGVNGLNIAFLNMQANDPNQATITSDPITTIAANTNYVASVAVGNDPGTSFFQNPGDVTLNLLANSVAAPGTFTVVSTSIVDTSSIPDDAFKNFTVSLSPAESTLLAGDSLEVQLLANDSTYPQASQAIFDNVTLEASPAPEPTTWAFLLGGLLLLIVIQRSRRMA